FSIENEKRGGRARCPQRAVVGAVLRRAGDSTPYQFRHFRSKRRICFNPLTSASSRRRLCLLVPLLLALTFFLSPAGAVTFTTNSYIGISDASYDSQDIEVTNCTLTI